MVAVPLAQSSSPNRLNAAERNPDVVSRKGRALDFTTDRKFTSISDVFLGLSLRVSEKEGVEGGGEEAKEVRWCVVVSDGFGTIHSEKGTMELKSVKENSGLFVERIVRRLREFSSAQGYKIQTLAIAEPIPEVFLNSKPALLPSIWLHLDAIPYQIRSSPTIDLNETDSHRHPNQPKRRQSTTIKNPKLEKFLTILGLDDETFTEDDMEVLAQRAMKESLSSLADSARSATKVNVDYWNDAEVEVDWDDQIKLAGLDEYKAGCSEDIWNKFTALCNHLKSTKTSISFFSATPQGGGVALMRHALIRLWRLVGVDVSWYVPEGHPAVFDITKRKFHNVLQNVCPPDTHLKDSEKELFQKWTLANFEAFWSEPHGPLNGENRIVVIDDPQLAGLIPMIKEKFGKGSKVLFRSHIQIESALADKAGTPQAETWDFLFNFIKQSDLFIAHPVKAFVPKSVLESLPVVYMAPSTDPLDGLNKPLGAEDMKYYRQQFGRLSEQQCGVQIDWERPYCVQIARFDPSKGIPDLLQAYRLFRTKLDEQAKPGEPSDVPVLIIAGHGSIDDPDGSMVFEEIHTILAKPEWSTYRTDVSAVRVPPCDRTLGAVLQGAWCALQLSTKEGFEVKVTEAVKKRVPIIASNAGGIPLQVKEGVNGWIVDAGDSEAVAQRLLTLLKDGNSLKNAPKQDSSPNALADDSAVSVTTLPAKIDHDGLGPSEDFFTVGNACKWMLLFSILSQNTISPGNQDEELLKEMGVGSDASGRDIWKNLEGRDVWEGVKGIREDGLVIQ